MRISVRKSGEVMVGMSELEAVTLQEINAAVNEALQQNPSFFSRSQKAVLRDFTRTLLTLDEEIEKAEKTANGSAAEQADENETPTVPASVEEAAEQTEVAQTKRKDQKAAEITATIGDQAAVVQG